MKVQIRDYAGRKGIYLEWEVNILYQNHGWRKESRTLALWSKTSVESVIEEMMEYPKRYGFKNFEEAEPFINRLMDELPNKWWQPL